MVTGDDDRRRRPRSDPERILIDPRYGDRVRSLESGADGVADLFGLVAVEP